MVQMIELIQCFVNQVFFILDHATKLLSRSLRSSLLMTARI